MKELTNINQLPAETERIHLHSSFIFSVKQKCDWDTQQISSHTLFRQDINILIAAYSLHKQESRHY